jgi:galactokinase
MNNFLRLIGQVAGGTVVALATNGMAPQIHKAIQQRIAFWQPSPPKEPSANNSDSCQPKL